MMVRQLVLRRHEPQHEWASGRIVAACGISPTPSLFRTHTEDVAIVGVGGSREVHARNRDTCM
jgi:hypothetical protein